MMQKNKVGELPENLHSTLLDLLPQVKKLVEHIQKPGNRIPVGDRKYARADDGADYLSISKSHFHQLVREGMLPPGKLITGAVRVWKVSELDEAAEKMWEVA